VRLLVLGGGGFLGHHAVTEALAAGGDVTVFNRTGKPPVPGVEAIAGDRRDDLSGLRGREWDAVFDTFTDTEPGAPAVRATAELLSGAAGAYGYVSGMSVYAPSGPSRPDESGPVRQDGVEPDTDRLQERSLAKLAGEAAVTELFDGPALFPRVGIMVGPRSTRFTYWPVRVAGAAVDRLPRSILVPGDRDRSVQYSDARDIAAWSVWMLALGRGGTFNTVGPGRPDSLWSVIDACCTAVGVDPAELDFVDVTDEDRLRAGLTDVDEEERPLWYPEDQIPQDAIDSSAALAAGLRFRPAAMTAADTLGWAQEAGEAALTDTFLPYEQELLASVRAGS
jgi:nucleoside-diphosphate-sugar epimerase